MFEAKDAGTSGPSRTPAILYWLPALATAALIFYLSHQPDLADGGLAIPDWILHLLEYGFFTATLLFATTRGFDLRLRRVDRVVAAVIIAGVYGITDEFHQGFVGRDPAVSDWLADIAGALLVGVLTVLVWRRMAGPQSRL